MKPLAIVESLDIGKEAPFCFLPSTIRSWLMHSVFKVLKNDSTQSLS